jgi:hypothetical protein
VVVGFAMGVLGRLPLLAVAVLGSVLSNARCALLAATRPGSWVVVGFAMTVSPE